MISSDETRKALINESKIFASVSKLILVEVRDLRTSDHICERYFV